ncbi:MAG: DedA family protein [Gemmataceae bacterium]|nr:DedA family protein [Gemmataceae bacterium]
MMDLINWGLSLLRELEPMLTTLAKENPFLFYGVLFAIIFAETGLVIAPFLPGDSLLFIVGYIATKPEAGVSLPLLLGLLIVAAVLGDAVNYSIGRWLGPKVFQAEKSWLFSKNHLLKAQAFYERWGAKTIILARFVPIVRTFAPFVAGIGRMEYPKFAFYNVAGGIAWVLICTMAGFWFGGLTWVKGNFEWVIVAIVVISVIPMAVELWLEWRRHKPAASSDGQRQAA